MQAATRERGDQIECVSREGGSGEVGSWELPEKGKCTVCGICLGSEHVAN